MKRLFAALLVGVGLLVPAAASAQSQPTPTTRVVVDCAMGYHVEPGTTKCIPNTATQPKPTCRIVALQNSPGVGATVNISWASTNATGGTITTIGSVGPKGIQGVIPIAPATTYTGTFTGPGGTGSCSITIAVTTQGTYGVSGSIGDASAIPDVGDGLFYVPTVSGQSVDGSGAYNGSDLNGTAPQGYKTPTPPTTLGSGGGTGGTLNTSGGLVSCGGTGDCNICTLSSTVQNILNFALGLSIPIAAAMFAYAGWLYFSNAESEDKIKKAKHIFRDALIGFCIALMAWLAVQTILKALAPGYSGWNSFQCGNLTRPGSTAGNSSNLYNVLNGAAGVPQQAPLATVTYTPSDTGTQYGGSGMTCDSSGSCFSSATGALLNGANSGVSCDPTIGCFNSDGSAVAIPTTVTPLNSAGVAQYSDQLAAACAQYGVSDCTIAKNIMAAETGGNCPQISGAGAVGCMQLMPTTACNLNSSINGCGSCTSWADNTNGNCGAVVQALKSDNNLNINLGVQYISQMQGQYGSCQNTAAAYNGGPNANKASQTCPGQTYWQCTANAGYLETRNYVAKVCGS